MEKVRVVEHWDGQPEERREQVTLAGAANGLSKDEPVISDVLAPVIAA